MTRFPSSSIRPRRVAALTVVMALGSLAIVVDRSGAPELTAEFAQVQVEVLGTVQTREGDAPTHDHDHGDVAPLEGADDSAAASTTSTPSEAPVDPALQSAGTSTEPTAAPSTAGVTPEMIAAVAAAQASPTPAPETAPPTTAASVPLDQRVLAAISFPWQEYLPGWRIEFVGPRNGYRGLTFTNDKVIQIYQRSDFSFDDYVHVLAHEIGHAIDVTYLDDSARAAWISIRGINANAPWWVSEGGRDFASGAGDWAESFAWWQTQKGGFFSELAGKPSVEQINSMANLIELGR